jgi:hypothetical protein
LKKRLEGSQFDNPMILGNIIEAFEREVSFLSRNIGE